jgi:hypothetical protein
MAPLEKRRFRPREAGLSHHLTHAGSEIQRLGSDRHQTAALADISPCISKAMARHHYDVPATAPLSESIEKSSTHRTKRTPHRHGLSRGYSKPSFELQADHAAASCYPIGKPSHVSQVESHGSRVLRGRVEMNCTVAGRAKVSLAPSARQVSRSTNP